MANALRSQYEDIEWKKRPFMDRYRSGLLDGSSSGKARWKRSRWNWLLPLLLLLAILASAWYAITHIEADIEQAAQDVLVANGYSADEIQQLDIDADWRDVQVDGVLPAGTDTDRLEQLLEDEVGLDDGDHRYSTDINNATVTATAAAPAALGAIAVAAAADGETITLTGSVPSQAHKDALQTEAESTGMIVDNQLTVSGLEPQSNDADGQVGRLAGVIGGLTAGSFIAADLSISDDGPVTGSIELPRGADASALSTLAGDGVDVSAPPELGALDTDVNYDGTRIILNGTVLSDAQADSLVASAAAVVGAENVVNNLEVSGLDEAVEGADARVDALGAAIGTFGGLSAADATMNDTDLTVNGEALDDAARDATVTAVTASENSGLRPGGEVTVAEAPEPELSLQDEIDLLQAELDALQDEIRENVVFATDSEVLTPAAQGTLDKVVAAMNRYTRPVVEVGGHTDSQGDDAYNEALSQRRAESVVTYITQSIEPGRLSPVGFGESQPIADNNLETGRLQNRRVELIAKENF